MRVSHCFSSATSAGTAAARPPDLRISPATASISDFVRAATTIVAPSPANLRAMARPIPRPPPVMTATFPVSSIHASRTIGQNNICIARNKTAYRKSRLVTARRSIEWYAPLVRGKPQHRISLARGSAKSVLFCSASIAVAAVLLSGMVEIESLAKPVAISLRSTHAPLGDHYLLLVNTAMAKQMDARKMEQFDRSPYDGLAVSFAGAYDTSPVVSAAAMQAQIASWKKFSGKDIWPWV